MNSQKLIITTSWDDGHPLDVKLCSILKKNGIKGTIYVPIKNSENVVMKKDEIKNISNNFEIGGHTYNHTILTNETTEIMISELTESKEALQKITNNEITSFCYPRGKYNNKVIEKVKQAGYKNGRTTELFRTAISNPYEIHTTIQAVNRILPSKIKQIFNTNDHQIRNNMLFSGMILSNWDKIAIKTFDHVMENGGIWHLWGHSWEIDRNNDWDKLKNVLNYVQTNGKKYGAEFLTNGELTK
jgi:peptidoglycan/xylan/chitin deacetylase (PgdA/CDA1 family)